MTDYLRLYDSVAFVDDTDYFWTWHSGSQSLFWPIVGGDVLEYWRRHSDTSLRRSSGPSPGAAIIASDLQVSKLTRDWRTFSKKYSLQHIQRPSALFSSRSTNYPHITVLQSAHFRTAASGTGCSHAAYLDLNLSSRLHFCGMYPGAERFPDGDIYKFCR